MAIVINSSWDEKLFKEEREKARKSINSAWDAQVFYETYGGHGEAGNWGTKEWAERNTVKSGWYYAYNPSTRVWEKASLSDFDTEGFLSTAITDSGDLSFAADSSGILSQVGVVNGQLDAATSSKTSAEKDYIEIEFNTLVGEINLIPTKDNMKIRTNTTINLTGVGKYLSGLYFVSEVRKSMSTDGYSLTVGLYKNGFGDNLKKNVQYSPRLSDRPHEVDVSNNSVTSRFKVGDRVKIVGDTAIYSNAHEGVLVPDYVKEKELVIEQISEDGLRARLSPIFSWTYVKFLQLL